MTSPRSSGLKPGRLRIGLRAGLFLWLAAALPTAGEWFPFVIPMAPNDESRIAVETSSILPDSPRVEAKDGHFWREGRRVRIWGVNLCFAANFPTHDEADRLAARMAQTGINGVRLHHMDTSAFPAGILDPANPLRLHPEACERLDYLIAQLARRGIYVNLNLHVGRAVSGRLGLPDPGTGYDKIVDVFMPALIESQKQYARDLLGHVNPYRKLRYADDPVIAFVEISNEDSLFMWNAQPHLRRLPPPYADQLRTNYAAWLRTKYGSAKALGKAWSQGTEALGANMLAPDRIAEGKAEKEKGWRMERHGLCLASVTQPRGTSGVVRIEIPRADRVAWHLQLKQSPLRLEGGRPYTLSFNARALAARPLDYSVMQDGTPWGGLGLHGSVSLTPFWQPFRVGFRASSTDATARLSFALGEQSGWVELSQVILAPGGQQGLKDEESLEKADVALFVEDESEARSADRMRFLMSVERDYFDGMRRFLRDELGVKAPVTGTIGFGPGGLFGQGGMDYIDSHAYWQHPQFPGRPWDPTNWLVEQRAMVDAPAEATLPRLATERVARRPFTLSEYNHPAPNDFQAECVPMVAAWAAAQDWDAVWLFAWSHRQEDPARARFDTFFDIDQNPAKLGFMRAGAAIFRQAAIEPLPAGRPICLIGNGAPLDALAQLHQRGQQPWGGPDLTAVFRKDGVLDWTRMLTEKVAVTFDTNEIPVTAAGSTRTHVTWRVGDGGQGGLFLAEGLGARVLVRHGDTGQAVEAAGLRVVQPAFAALTVTALDGLPFEDTRLILVTACGRCENEAMGFSADRRTVGRDWGRAPVRVEPVEGTVALPSGRWRGWVLGPDGTPRADAVIGIMNTGMVMRIGGPLASMWYLAERQ